MDRLITLMVPEWTTVFVVLRASKQIFASFRAETFEDVDRLGGGQRQLTRVHRQQRIEQQHTFRTIGRPEWIAQFHSVARIFDDFHEE